MKLQIKKLQIKFLWNSVLKPDNKITEFNTLTNVLLLIDVFRKYVKDSPKTYSLISFYFISISGYTKACAVGKTKQRIDYSKGEDFYLSIKKY